MLVLHKISDFLISKLVRKKRRGEKNNKEEEYFFFPF